MWQRSCRIAGGRMAASQASAGVVHGCTTPLNADPFSWQTNQGEHVMKAQFLALAAAALVVFSIPDLALANKAHGMIEKMSNSDRNTTFTAFLKNSGVDCGSVTRNFFQGFDKSRNAFWNVACSNKKSYIIMINNDSVGSTRIMSCDVLKAVNAGECFKKF
jgi:hypothetical protein